MAFKTSSYTYAQRPTLPPLRDLNLPMPGTSYQYLHHPVPHRARQASISSSTTSSSPSPPPASSSPQRPHLLSPAETLRAKITSGHKVRLVPCSLEEAEAVVVVPPTTPTSPEASSPLDATTGKPQALFLVGSMIERHLRHPSRVLTKGARIHPYRAARDGERRNSMRYISPADL